MGVMKKPKQVCSITDRYVKKKKKKSYDLKVKVNYKLTHLDTKKKKCFERVVKLLGTY